jgi:hypothetical protein
MPEPIGGQSKLLTDPYLLATAIASPFAGSQSARILGKAGWRRDVTAGYERIGL